MAKQLDEKTIMNELHGESAFFRPSPATAQETTSQRVVTQRKKKEVIAHPQMGLSDKNSSQPVEQLVDPSTSPSANQSTEQLDNQSAAQSLNQAGGRSVDTLANEVTSAAFDISPVLSRPKSFYITEKQDEDLDSLVKKITERVKGRVVLKIDRSVTTRLIFECVDLTSDETAERLAKLLTSRLASQLAGRLDS